MIDGVMVRRRGFGGRGARCCSRFGRQRARHLKVVLLFGRVLRLVYAVFVEFLYRRVHLQEPYDVEAVVEEEDHTRDDQHVCVDLSFSFVVYEG